MNDNRIPNEFDALLNERDAMIEAALGAAYVLSAEEEQTQVARLLAQTHEPDEAGIVPLKRRARRPGRRFLILAAAILLTLILLGSTIAVEPVRHYIWNTSDGTNIIFKNEYVEDSLNERFNYIPAGFALVKEEHDRLGNHWSYRDAYGNGLDIDTIDTMKNKGKTFINTEDVGYEEVEIQGHSGLYVERPGDCRMLVWTTGKYHHAVIADLTETSRVTREDMFKIANEREIVSTRNNKTKDSLNESYPYIPQGYALQKVEREKLSNYFVYKDENDNRISILSVKNGSSIFVNTEDVGYEEVDIQGQTGCFVERDECFLLTWSTGTYTHSLYADKSSATLLTKADVIKIASSRELDDPRKIKIQDTLKESYPYIPQGYTLEKEEHDRKHNYYLYADENQNELVISTMKNGSVVSVNSEGVGVQIVIIQGQTGFLTERDNGLILVWSTGKYTHRIVADITETANISREEVLRIASSREIK